MLTWLAGPIQKKKKRLNGGGWEIISVGPLLNLIMTGNTLKPE